MATAENKITRLFALDLRALPEPKSTDRIFVRYNRARSFERTVEDGHEVSVYEAFNMTTREGAYDVELSRVNGRNLGGCTCVSREICKHILRSVLLHVARKRAQQRRAAELSVDNRTDAERWREALA